MPALPAFATVDDLEIRAGHEVQRGRAQAALDDVSALIRLEASKDWVVGDPPALDPDTPPIVAAVCVTAARRAYENPNNYGQETIAGYSYSVKGDDSAGGVALTDAEIRQIRRAAGGVPGLSTIGVTRGPLETAGCGGGDRVFLETDPPGDPILWTEGAGY